MCLLIECTYSVSVTWPSRFAAGLVSETLFIHLFDLSSVRKIINLLRTSLNYKLSNSVYARRLLSSKYNIAIVKFSNLKQHLKLIDKLFPVKYV